MTSNFEINCRNILETIFAAKFPSCRPGWLRNPRTSRPLQLDCYNMELRLAFECDGVQHKAPSFFNDNGKSLDDIKYRDKAKDELCDDHGVILLRIPQVHSGNHPQILEAYLLVILYHNHKRLLEYCQEKLYYYKWQCTNHYQITLAHKQMFGDTPALWRDYVFSIQDVECDHYNQTPGTQCRWCDQTLKPYTCHTARYYDYKCWRCKESIPAQVSWPDQPFFELDDIPLGNILCIHNELGYCFWCDTSLDVDVEPLWLDQPFVQDDDRNLADLDLEDL